MSDNTALKSILLLAANPKGTVSLRLQEEEREIRERLRLAGYGKVPINSVGSARSRDIQQAMVDFKPQVVHFTGHGTGEAGLVFEDVTGEAKLVTTAAIANLFEIFADRVECVVLNACHTEVQAEAIVKYINYAIGMNEAIGDRAAIAFAIGFYTGLGAGESIERAYKLGCNAIQLEDIPEHLTPVLYKKESLTDFSQSSATNTADQKELRQSQQTALANVTAGGNVIATVHQTIHNYNNPPSSADPPRSVKEPTTPTPPQLSTYDRATFAGREERVAELLEKLQGQTRLVWITGMSGIGKTTLGECVASRAWESDQAFQWVYLEILEGQSPDFGAVAAELLGKMGDVDLDPQLRNNPEQIAQRLIQRLKSSPYWIQLDSLERLLNPDQPTEFVDAYWAIFLQRCLTESDLGSRLVLTSQVFPIALGEFVDRYPKTWAEYRLAGLEIGAQQLEFFAKRGVESSHGDILTRIAQTYEGHPLVLKVMAEEILQGFGGDVLGFWREYQREFEGVARELSGGGLAETEYNEALDRRVRERLKKSLVRLPQDALDLLCRSAVFRRPVPKKFWLGMLGNRSLQTQKTAYRVLGDHALIEKEGRAIRQHNLIRDLAYNLLKADPDAWEAAERQAAHLWLTLYQPGLEDANLEKVRGYLEAFDHYCEVEDWETAKDVLLTPLDSFGEKDILRQIFDWSLYQEGILIGQKILKKSTLDADVVFLKMLGNDYLFLGNYPTAINYYEQSLAIAQEIGDRRGKGAALGNLGLAYNNLGQYDRAIDFHQQYLTITREVGDRQGEGAVLGNLGIVYDNLGQYDQAINFYQQSLTIAREIGNCQGEGAALGNLGGAYHRLGQYDQVMDFYHQSLTIAREIGNRQGESNSLGGLGCAYSSLGQYPQAIDFLQQYLTIAQEIGDCQGEGAALRNLGGVYNSLGQYERAINCYQQYLTIAREIDDRQGEAIFLGNLGLTQMKLKQYSEALENMSNTLTIFQDIGSRDGEAEALKCFAEIHQALGDLNLARQYCQQALALAKELGIPLAAECEALLLKIDSKIEDSSTHHAVNIE